MNKQERWDRFHKIRHQIHEVRRVLQGIPPDHWEITEIEALNQIINEEVKKAELAKDKIIKEKDLIIRELQVDLSNAPFC